MIILQTNIFWELSLIYENPIFLLLSFFFKHNVWVLPYTKNVITEQWYDITHITKIATNLSRALTHLHWAKFLDRTCQYYTTTGSMLSTDNVSLFSLSGKDFHFCLHCKLGKLPKSKPAELGTLSQQGWLWG